MMKFNKKAAELTLEEIWNVAYYAVTNKEGCTFQVEEGKANLKVNDLTLDLNNFTTGERWEKFCLEQPEEMEAVQFLAHILLTW